MKKLKFFKNISVIVSLLLILVFCCRSIAVHSEEAGTNQPVNITEDDVRTEILESAESISSLDSATMAIKIKFLPDKQPSVKNNSFALKLQDEFDFAEEVNDTVFVDQEDYPCGTYSINTDTNTLYFTFDEAWLLEHSSDISGKFWFNVKVSENVSPDADYIPFSFPGQTEDKEIRVNQVVQITKEVLRDNFYTVEKRSRFDMGDYGIITNPEEEAEYKITFKLNRDYTNLKISDGFTKYKQMYGDILSVTENGTEILNGEASVVSLLKDKQERTGFIGRYSVSFDFFEDIYKILKPQSTVLPAGEYTITYKSPISQSALTSQSYVSNPVETRVFEENIVEISSDDQKLGEDSAELHFTTAYSATGGGGGWRKQLQKKGGINQINSL